MCCCGAVVVLCQKEAYIRAISAIARNLAAHIYLDNMARHSTATRAIIFAVLEASRDDPPRQRVSAARQVLAELHSISADKKTIQHLIKKYEANGYVFDGKDAPRSGRKRLIGDVGAAEIEHELRSLPLRKVARSGVLFEDVKGSQVIVKRGTLVSDSGGELYKHS